MRGLLLSSASISCRRWTWKLMFSWQVTLVSPHAHHGERKASGAAKKGEKWKRRVRSRKRSEELAAEWVQYEAAPRPFHHYRCTSSGCHTSFTHKHINTTNYWKWKKRLCMRLLEVVTRVTPPEKICRSQSTSQSVQQNEHLPYWFVLCNLRIFSGSVYHLQQPRAQSLFLFPTLFGIRLLQVLFSIGQEEERCSHTFDHLSSILRSLVARQKWKRMKSRRFFFVVKTAKKIWGAEPTFSQKSAQKCENLRSSAAVICLWACGISKSQFYQPKKYF